ncbi:hypothetical protein HAX54_044374 [Datura stramonium]|uniref:Uncharacterized protein n=1 Tax=Datura stramonium TaxID=4076 RepID=A0ABS8SP33_DATST|nr:hypothetical protein [Datura stramonium]
MEYYILLCFFIWLISTIVLVRNNGTTFHLPPSPLKLPLIGHLHLLTNKPHEALYKLSNKYGPLFHLFIGSVPCVVVSSAEIAKSFLKNNEIIYSNRPKISNIDYLTYHQGFSFAPYGPYWKFMKILCISKLLGGQTLHLLLPIRREEIKRLIQVLSRNAVFGKAVNIRSEITAMTNNVITRMVMSKGCSENEDGAEKVREMIHEMATLSGRFNLSDTFWFCEKWDLQGFRKKLKGVRDRFDEIMESIIEEHQEIRRKRHKLDQQQQVAKDLLEILLDISEDETSEMPLTRENIKAFVLDLFSGGTDTSSIAIEWALAELINHPDIMKKAAQEIDTVTGKNRLVEESDISQLPYLQAIVKETLRLHSPAPMILRESSEDCTIEGYHIPSKTRLFVNLWAMNRDPKYWETPLEFRPERFMTNENKKLDARGHNYFHYLPFGSGRRGCPGISLSLQILHTSLAAIIQCFEWEVGDQVDMEEGTGVTIPRAHPLVCVPVLRFNPFPNEI